jgi:hypothetical protein
MEEFALVATCTLGRLRAFHTVSGGGIQLPVIPHAGPLQALLRQVLSRADVVIFNFGIWYNWDPAEASRESGSLPDPEYTTEQVEACIRRAAGQPVPLAEGCPCRAGSASASGFGDVRCALVA